MKCQFTIGEDQYEADLNNGQTIAIPLRPNHKNPNCFWAPPPTAEPVKSGDWIGSIKQGGNLNFFNVHLNPHGNGTHTECFAHIIDTNQTINQTITRTMVSAFLVSIYPELLDNGDKIIGDQAESMLEEVPDVEALIIRTLPNEESKLTRTYSGTNPTYFSPKFMQKVVDKGIQHLLVDLPSVDREEDGGKLMSHKTFWHTQGAIRRDATITELIYVPNETQDGIFLLEICICPLEIDASPSRPILYKTYKI